jgi:hypothetical protein
VTTRWLIEDTGTAANISPVLRIQARDVAREGVRAVGRVRGPEDR